jgi:hypothetical protein
MRTWSVLDYQSIHRKLWIYTIRVGCDCKNQSCMWLIGGNTVHKNNIIFPAFYFYYLSFFNSIFLINIKFICDWIL